jgi:hypothetical protein
LLAFNYKQMNDKLKLIIMKKNTVFSIGLVLGLFLISGFLNTVVADDHQDKVARKPVSIQNLPEDVKEAIQDDYEGFRIVGAIMVTRNGDGAEGTEGTRRHQEGTEHQRDTDMEREGTETQRQREGTQRETQREGAETQREGTQQPQREGAETQREGTEAQREGTQRETQREGAETQREGTQRETQREGAETQREGTQRETQREGAETQRDDEIRVEQDRDRQRDDDNDNDRGIFEGVFTDEDTYYELTIQRGDETKVVRYDENGNELEIGQRERDDRDDDDNDNDDGLW